MINNSQLMSPETLGQVEDILAPHGLRADLLGLRL
jgi:hypothetical protein